MDDENFDRSPISDDWFTLCKEKFKALSPSQKSSVILSLIDMCDTTVRFHLLKTCDEALHRDVISSMPQVALDKVLDMLSVPDILNSCKVCYQWNKRITQSTHAWKSKWIEMGIGSDKDLKVLNKRDWKQDCVTAQELYHKIASGKALDYDLDDFNDGYGYITALDYCNGKLVLCHSFGAGGSVFSQKGFDWNLLCSFPAAEHGHPSSVRFLPTNLIIVAGNNGKITFWRLLKLKPGLVRHEVRLLHACHGHTSVVLSVDGCEDLGVVVSGSRDSRVKVWSINSGCCLKTYDYSSPVLQVSFLCGSNTLLEGFNFMLIHSSDKIYLQYWKCTTDWSIDGPQEQCILTDANVMPGIHINNGTLYYCTVFTIDGLHQTDFNCKRLNAAAIVGKQQGPFYSDDKVFSFQGLFRKLMQVGLVFALLIADDNIMAIDLKKGSMLFKEFVPYSAATSPTLPQVTAGVGKWLDGLLQVKRFGMILALAIYGRNLTLISWETSIPEFLLKED